MRRADRRFLAIASPIIAWACLAAACSEAPTSPRNQADASAATEGGPLGEVCGDGVRAGAEECDGADLAGRSCSSEGFSGGGLACKPDCTLDTTKCERCGDGAINGSEACDGSALGAKTCQSEGFDSGTLACAASCQLDLSGCRVATCGNGVRDAKEACEGKDLGGKTCQSLGFQGGALSCDSNCALNTASCTKCGDGVINGAEACDGTKLGGKTCKSLGYAGGTLACKSNCAFDTTACTKAPPLDQGLAPDKGKPADQGLKADHADAGAPSAFCSTFPSLPPTKPTASNTGVPAGTVLTPYAGPYTITTNGAVIDGKDITQTLTINASNVTIKNSKIHPASGQSTMAIVVKGSGTKILFSEVYTASGGGYVGILGGDMTVCGCYLHGWENAMTVSGGVMVQANYIDKLLSAQSGAHYDGIEMYDGSNSKFWGNNIRLTDASDKWRTETGALNVTTEWSSIKNVEIRGNWFGGGSYTLYIRKSSSGNGYTYSAIKVQDNRWYGKAPKGYAAWGPISDDGGDITYTGNVWDDDGSSL